MTLNTSHAIAQWLAQGCSERQGVFEQCLLALKPENRLLIDCPPSSIKPLFEQIKTLGWLAETNLIERITICCQGKVLGDFAPDFIQAFPSP